MNRRALMRHLLSYGCFIEREGRRHTIVGRRDAFDVVLLSPVPRHSELARGTVRAVCDDLRVPVPL